jgi:hypothetical protein
MVVYLAGESPHENFRMALAKIMETQKDKMKPGESTEI